MAIGRVDSEYRTEALLELHRELGDGSFGDVVAASMYRLSDPRARGVVSEYCGRDDVADPICPRSEGRRSPPPADDPEPSGGCFAPEGLEQRLRAGEGDASRAALSCLAPLAAADRPVEEGSPYLLTAYVAGRSYSVEAQDYGDWYDLEQVLGLLNLVAVETGSADRFVALRA